MVQRARPRVPGLWVAALWWSVATTRAWSVGPVGHGRGRPPALAAERRDVAFDGRQAGRRADPAFEYDEATMAGPLGKRVDGMFEARFRGKLAAELGVDDRTFDPGFNGLIEMIRVLHDQFPTRSATVAASRNTLRGLFPDWPPGAPADQVGLLWWFGVLFARPFPAFSCKLNAWVTSWATHWLMGPSTLQQLDESDNPVAGDGSWQELLVHRCRYLEQAGCASVCVNTCKLPTQQFFNEDMRVPMRMLPDYETFECRFQFGLAPTLDDEEEARAVTCFAACPSAKKSLDGALVAPCSSMGSSSSLVGADGAGPPS